MAETNVMGIFEFPPNIFDKILDRFSQAVQDNKYQKLDYVFWRKLKTSKNKVRIVVKSDLNGKLFFDIYPDVYITNYSFLSMALMDLLVSICLIIFVIFLQMIMRLNALKSFWSIRCAEQRRLLKRIII